MRDAYLGSFFFPPFMYLIFSTLLKELSLSSVCFVKDLLSELTRGSSGLPHGSTALLSAGAVLPLWICTIQFDVR